MIHKRKGVTLAEMAIVMAVIAIVSLSVVSFVMITSGRGTNSIAKLNVMEEIELVESFVDQWFQAVALEENAATDGAKIQIGDDTGDMSKVSYSNSAQLSLKNYVLTIEFPKVSDYSTYHFEKVQKLVFDFASSQSGDILYFCTVTYEQEEDGAKQTYTFCINPRVGEIIGEKPDENAGNTDNAGGEIDGETGGDTGEVAGNGDGAGTDNEDVSGGDVVDQ